MFFRLPFLPPSVCGDFFFFYPKKRGAQAPPLDLPRISVKLKKWKFGRTRNAAGTWANRQGFSQLFQFKAVNFGRTNFTRWSMNRYNIHVPAWPFDILKYLDIETIDLNLQEAAEYCMNKEINVFVPRHWFGWA